MKIFEGLKIFNKKDISNKKENDYKDGLPDVNIVYTVDNYGESVTLEFIAILGQWFGLLQNTEKLNNLNISKQIPAISFVRRNNFPHNIMNNLLKELKLLFKELGFTEDMKIMLTCSKEEIISYNKDISFLTTVIDKRANQIIEEIPMTIRFNYDLSQLEDENRQQCLEIKDKDKINCYRYSKDNLGHVNVNLFKIKKVNDATGIWLERNIANDYIVSLQNEDIGVSIEAYNKDGIKIDYESLDDDLLKLSDITKIDSLYKLFQYYLEGNVSDLSSLEIVVYSKKRGNVDVNINSLLISDGEIKDFKVTRNGYFITYDNGNWIYEKGNKYIVIDPKGKISYEGFLEEEKDAYKLAIDEMQEYMCFKKTI